MSAVTAPHPTILPPGLGSAESSGSGLDVYAGLALAFLAAMAVPGAAAAYYFKGDSDHPVLWTLAGGVASIVVLGSI